MKPGTYVTDASASGRYYPRVYRVVRDVSGGFMEVEDVGDVVNGRLTNFPRERTTTYRWSHNLRLWTMA